jgi:hypothetical protein
VELGGGNYSSTGNWLYTTSTSTSMPLVISNGGGGGAYVATWPTPEAEPASPLEWLDSEIEKTCALARAA